MKLGTSRGSNFRQNLQGKKLQISEIIASIQER